MDNRSRLRLFLCVTDLLIILDGYIILVRMLQYDFASLNIWIADCAYQSSYTISSYRVTKKKDCYQCGIRRRRRCILSRKVPNLLQSASLSACQWWYGPYWKWLKHTESFLVLGRWEATGNSSYWYFHVLPPEYPSERHHSYSGTYELLINSSSILTSRLVLLYIKGHERSRAHLFADTLIWTMKLHR